MLQVGLGGTITPGTAALADPRTLFEEGDSSAGQTAVMDEAIADGTSRPPAAQQRQVPIQPPFADAAYSGLNAQQHGFPLAPSKPNAHGGQYIQLKSIQASTCGLTGWESFATLRLASKAPGLHSRTVDIKTVDPDKPEPCTP